MALPGKQNWAWIVLGCESKKKKKTSEEGNSKPFSDYGQENDVDVFMKAPEIELTQQDFVLSSMKASYGKWRFSFVN